MGVGDTMYAFCCNIVGMWGVRVLGTVILFALTVLCVLLAMNLTPGRIRDLSEPGRIFGRVDIYFYSINHFITPPVVCIPVLRQDAPFL